MASSGSCVPGGAAFDPVFASLTSGVSSGGYTQWTLTFQTYTPNSYAGTLGPNAFGDAMIQYDGVDYGIVLGTDSVNSLMQPEVYGSGPDGGATGHDGLVAGGLYEEPTNPEGQPWPNYPGMYETAEQASGSGPRNGEPVWVNPNSVYNLNGTPLYNQLISLPGNSFSVVENACYTSGGIPTSCPDTNSNDYGLWTITDTFDAPSSFLASGVFSFEVASYVCANGLIIGTTPEPRGLFLIIPVVLLLGWRFKRSHSAQLS